MRVLITTDSYYPDVNGASVFGQRLAAGLRDRGHDVLVVAPGTSAWSGYHDVQGIKVYGVRSVPAFVYKNMRVVVPVDVDRRTITAINDFQPDVVHVQGHFPVSRSVIRNAKAAGIPVVGTNHFMPENLTHYAHLPARMDVMLQHKLWGKFRGIFENIDLVTTPTARAAGYMEKNGFGREIRVISNGIDLQRFNPGRAQEAFREKYGLPDLPLLLYVGRLDKEKNLDVVLRAISRVPDSVAVHFAIAGTGALRERLERFAAELQISDRVSFLGYVPDEDLPAFYCAGHSFVLAGTAELQSIATMEAMASGLPVLAADAVALPELVHTGRNGFLFEPGNHAMLADQLTLLFTDAGLHRQMADESLRMIQKHAVERTMEAFETSYAEAIHENAAAAPHLAPKRRRVLTPSLTR
jgi:1,2-diacylglycerol 3-alpha-glucosyltransferase